MVDCVCDWSCEGADVGVSAGGDAVLSYKPLSVADSTVDCVDKLSTACWAILFNDMDSVELLLLSNGAPALDGPFITTSDLLLPWVELTWVGVGKGVLLDKIGEGVGGMDKDGCDEDDNSDGVETDVEKLVLLLDRLLLVPICSREFAKGLSDVLLYIAPAAAA